MIRVLIADDQVAVRSALRLILDAESDIQVVDEAANGLEAIQKTRWRRPDIVVIDIRMPHLDGIAAIRQLTDPSESHVPTMIALTTFALDEYVYGALQAGAVGFLLKDNEPKVLLDAVRAAHHGQGLIDPQVTRTLITRFAVLSPQPPTPELAQLTAREYEVLQYVARGLSNAEIAAALSIGEGTVKTHVARILSKLGLRTRVHAVIYAQRHGLTIG